MFGLPFVCLKTPPRGLVVYASRDSLLPGYAAYLDGGARVGYLRECDARSGWRHRKGHRFYRVESFTHGVAPRAVAMADQKQKNGDYPLSDPVSWKEVGHARREKVLNADGLRPVKNDSTGMFQVIPEHFHTLYGSRRVPFANVHDDQAKGGSERETRANFFEGLGKVKEKGLDFFAYAGHGTPRGLPSACVFVGRGNGMDEMVEEIKRLCRPDGWVLLYACHTAAEGGFAVKLSEALPRMTVMGHRQRGAGDANPLKYRIVNGRSVAVRDEMPPEVRKLWQPNKLREKHLYARLPFMTTEQIADELQGKAK